MSIPTTPGFVVKDAIALPHDDAPPVRTTAVRADDYRVTVVRSVQALIDALLPQLEGAAVALITDDDVEALYGGLVLRALRGAGVEVIAHSVPAGEASKSCDRAFELWDWLAESQIARRDVIVNLGGGVICDLGGWVASGYMRGLRYVNLPTTLLAQVDGALGGKVAVNHPRAKNLLGAFHQPAAVVANVGFLGSTDSRHLAAGLAEAIKKAMIASPEYWEFIESRADRLLAHDAGALERLVRSAAAIKLELVERDPYEIDLRRPLNFGHTIGHPLETVTGYGPLLHGEAVAFGMVVECRIAVARGLLDPALLDRLIALLQRCRLPTCADELPAPVDGEAVIRALEKVRLIRAGSLRYVLPRALGETVIVDDVTTGEARAALAECGVALAEAEVM